MLPRGRLRGLEASTRVSRMFVWLVGRRMFAGRGLGVYSICHNKDIESYKDVCIACISRCTSSSELVRI